MATIDPELTRAIEEAKTKPFGHGDRVRAVVTLRSKDPSKPLSADQATNSINQIVAKATKKTHRQPRNVVIFPNIQSFSIDADARFLDGILSEDSVATAALNG